MLLYIYIIYMVLKKEIQNLVLEKYDTNKINTNIENCLLLWEKLINLYYIKNIDINFLDTITVENVNLFSGFKKTLYKTSNDNYLLIAGMNIDELEIYLYCLVSYYENNINYIFKIPNLYIKIIDNENKLQIYTDNIKFDYQIKSFKQIISAQYLDIKTKLCFSHLFENETKEDILLYLESMIDILYFFNKNNIYCVEYEILFNKNAKQVYLIDLGYCIKNNESDDSILVDLRIKYFKICNIYFAQNTDIFKLIVEYRKEFLENKIDIENLNIMRNEILNNKNFNKEYMTYYAPVFPNYQDLEQILYGGYRDKYLKYKFKYSKLKNKKLY